MDITFRRMIDKYMPKANPVVMKGLAYSHLPKAPEYLESIMKSATALFPPGTEYHGSRPCTPTEEFRWVTRASNSRRTADIARSDVRLYMHILSLNGVELRPIYYFVPFCSVGGISHLAGNMIHFMPTQQENVISPSSNGVFARFAKDKINCYSVLHTFLENDKPKTHSVVHSKLHRDTKNKKKVKATTKALTCLLHYLLAKHGFKLTFAMYFKAHPIVFDSPEQITGVDLDEYDVFRSTGAKPHGFIGNGYVPSDMVVLIRKTEVNTEVLGAVCSFFYILDNFPTSFRSKDLDNTNNWKILLGHINLSGSHSDGMLLETMTKHIWSLDHYLDTVIDDKLKHMGYHVGDFYGFLALMMRNYCTWVANAGVVTHNGVGGKWLDVLYNILYPIQYNIFTLSYEVSRARLKKDLGVTELNKIITTQAKPKTIYRLTDASPAVTTVSSPSDLLYPKITSKLAKPTPPGGKAGKRLQIDSSKRGSPKSLTTGAILQITKSSTDPDAVANMFLNLDSITGQILPKESFSLIINDIEESLDQTTH